MQSLAIRQRKRLGARAPWHVGDIALDLDSGDPALLDEILAEPPAKTAWGFEDLVPALERHGFTRPGESMHFYVRDDLDVRTASLPAGFRCPTVEPADLAERVAVHGDVWAPSRVTDGLHRWREEGGREAIVSCVDGGACALYESVGFRRHATLVGYSR